MQAATPVDERADGPGVSYIDPANPAAPLYQLLNHMRHPVTLRDLMILPVRTGYIGDRPLDSATLPPAADKLYPQVAVSELRVPSPAGPVRCRAGRFARLSADANRFRQRRSADRRQPSFRGETQGRRQQRGGTSGTRTHAARLLLRPRRAVADGEFAYAAIPSLIRRRFG